MERAAAALNPLAAAAYDAHERLAGLVGTTHLLRRRGWLRLYRSPEAFAGAAPERRLLERHGVATETVEGRAVRELEPALADRFSHGLLFPQTGSVEDPGALVAACEAAFRARGGAVVAGRAAGLAQTGEGVAADLDPASAGPRRLTASHAVLAAGAWSDGLARSLGLSVPLAAEQGSHVHVTPRGNHGLTRPVNDTGGGYVVSPAGGALRLLTGVRLARADDPPDDGQLHLVLADAARTLPLGDPVPGTEWHGSRPSTPDGLPVIGPAPGAPRVILSFGHGHVGFATAPVTAGIVADLATGRAPAIPVAPFAAERFRRAPR